MPITAFNSFTDGLDPNQRSREHLLPTSKSMTNAAGFRTPKVCGSSPAASTSRPGDSASF